jgi:hypothetical protein
VVHRQTGQLWVVRRDLHLHLLDLPQEEVVVACLVANQGVVVAVVVGRLCVLGVGVGDLEGGLVRRGLHGLHGLHGCRVCF